MAPLKASYMNMEYGVSGCRVFEVFTVKYMELTSESFHPPDSQSQESRGKNPHNYRISEFFQQTPTSFSGTISVDNSI